MKKTRIIACTLMLGLMLTACGKKEDNTTEAETATMNYIEATTAAMEKVASGKGNGTEVLPEPEPTSRDIERSGEKELDAGGYKIKVAHLNFPKEDFTDEEILKVIEEYRTRMGIDMKIKTLAFTGYTEKGYTVTVRFENDSESNMEYRKDNGTWKLYTYQPGVELDEYGSVIDDDEPTHN